MRLYSSQLDRVIDRPMTVAGSYDLSVKGNGRSDAGQNAAGSLGNLICPNNVVAACATVNQIGREGDVLRITFKAFFVILVEYMIIAMLYTYVIFPTFGL